MNLQISHVTDVTSHTDIHLYVSTKEEGNYFENIFGVTEESGRYLVLHCLKEKSADGSYPCFAFVEGTIYDKNGEVAIVPNRMFHDDDLTAINEWLKEHEEEWIKEIEK